MNYLGEIYLDKLIDVEILEKNGEKGIFIPFDVNRIYANRKHTTLRIFCGESQKANAYGATHYIKHFCGVRDLVSDKYINNNILGNLRIRRGVGKKFDKNLYQKKDLKSLDEILHE